LASSLAVLSMTELVETLASSGIKPVEIRPWLAVSWQRMRRQVGSRSGWYALVEPGRVALASVAGGRFQSLRSALTPADPAPALSGLIRREALLGGASLAAAPLWIDCILERVDWRGLEGGLSVQAPAAGSDTLAAMLGV
jgi:hypothetical protein